MSDESWGFYGRRDELDHLSDIFNRGRWFFVKISGRRRIGKTTLGQAALRASNRNQVLKGIEIDMVALDETGRRIRLATCKRSVHRVIPDLAAFDGHIARFLEAMPRFRESKVEKAAITPQHSAESREWLVSRGWIPQDLTDLTQGL